jgi:hypothetical protein
MFVKPSYEAYFDDSGTDGRSRIAVAACYVSTVTGWNAFTEAWDAIRREEGFDVFHMAEFVAPREQGHKPFCDWENDKKQRVYSRVARAINENKRVGIACAVPKGVYDRCSDYIHEHYGREHYTFAVNMILNQIVVWREKSLIALDAQYIFDWEMNGSSKKGEIDAIWNKMHPSWSEKLGTLGRDGYSFQHKDIFKPLQAADILAWQMRSHMERIFDQGYDTLEDAHFGFRLLREDQEMDLGFFTEDQMGKWASKQEALDREFEKITLLRGNSQHA